MSVPGGSLSLEWVAASRGGSASRMGLPTIQVNRQIPVETLPSLAGSNIGGGVTDLFYPLFTPSPLAQC